MDTASDNPLKRFSSFWLGLILIAAFGILALVLVPFIKNSREDAVYEAAASKRRATLGEMEAAQAAALKVAPEKLFAKVGGELLSMKPGAVRDNAQIVPGSARAIALENAPEEVVTIEKVDPEAPLDPAVMKAGEAAYMLCSACHGAAGQGMAGLAPPLNKSEWATGPVENLIRIQLRGLIGAIHVGGTKYEMPAPMVAQAFQTDEQIAAVLTFVRNSWDNKAGAVTPQQVAAFRGEVGKPPLTVKDLVPPTEDHPDFK